MSDTLSADQRGSVLGAAARHSAVTFTGVAWAGLFGFLLVIVMTQGLGVRGYGVLATVVALFTILGNVAKLGADTGLLREIPRLRVGGQARDLPAVLVAALVPPLAVGAALGAATWALAPDLSGLLLDEPAARREMVAALRAVAPFLGVAGMMIAAVVGTRGFGSSVPSAAVQSFLVPTLRVGFVLLALAWATPGPASAAAVAAAYGLPTAVGLAVALLLLHRRTRRALGGAGLGPARPWAQVSRSFWSFTAPRSMAGTLEVLMAWGGVLLVSALGGAEQAGVFGAVLRYVVLGTFAIQAVRVAIGPHVSMLLAERRLAEAERVFQTMTCWLIAAAWPFYLLLAIFPEVLLDVFGDGFRAGAAALVVMSLAKLVDMATGNVTLVLLMSGHSRWNLLNVAAGLLAAVGLSFALVPRWGVLGAAMAWSTAVLVENLAATAEVARLVGLRPFSALYAHVVATSLVAFAAVPGLARLIVGPGWPALLGALGLGGALHAGLLWRARGALGLDEAWAGLRRRRAAATGGHR